jgi:hypothetical protein
MVYMKTWVSNLYGFFNIVLCGLFFWQQKQHSHRLFPL